MPPTTRSKASKNGSGETSRITKSGTGRNGGNSGGASGKRIKTTENESPAIRKLKEAMNKVKQAKEQPPELLEDGEMERLMAEEQEIRNQIDEMIRIRPGPSHDNSLHNDNTDHNSTFSVGNDDVGIDDDEDMHTVTSVTSIKEEQEEVPQSIESATVEDKDDLGNEFLIKVNNERLEPSLQNQQRRVVGHIMRNSRHQYCVLFGDKYAYSARFEGALPHDSEYDVNNGKDCGDDRIIEEIIKHHRKKKTTRPDFLSKIQILAVYWDNKTGLGRKADVDVLHPDYGKPEHGFDARRRPTTRCYIRLDPSLYKDYNIENKSGYSHETRSMVKLCMPGVDDYSKSIALYNEAVELENRYEDRFMREVEGRPSLPLSLLAKERSTPVRQSTPIRQSTPMPRTIWTRQAAKAARQMTPIYQSTPTRQTTHIRHVTPAPRVNPEFRPFLNGQRSPARQDTVSYASQKDEFHALFLELFDIREGTTYEELDESKKLLYPAQYALFKRGLYT